MLTPVTLSLGPHSINIDWLNILQWTWPPCSSPPAHPHVATTLIPPITLLISLHSKQHGCLLPIKLKHPVWSVLQGTTYTQFIFFFYLTFLRTCSVLGLVLDMVLEQWGLETHSAQMMVRQCKRNRPQNVKYEKEWPLFYNCYYAGVIDWILSPLKFGCWRLNPQCDWVCRHGL